MAKSKEIHFEDEVFDGLVAHGWEAGIADDLDLDSGLALAQTLAFVADTQMDEWDALLTQMGGDAERAQREFRKRLVAEIDRRGTVDVLRQGIRGWGLRFDLCYFRPAHGLTPSLVEKYEANRLTVTRQQRYHAKHNNTLDIVLWVNGLAVATVELKNLLTHQGVVDAIAQYRSVQRSPKDPFLTQRAVVHFAVDPHEAYMTTRLEGTKTWFLPFNQGHDGRPGNPPTKDGSHRTSYLWEKVWQRDAWLDIVGRFLHREPDQDGKPGRLIFPRYHQWDCVLRLEDDARTNGPGNKYLVQHSAGSGKSNSIAWLAHRLSKLHDTFDKPVFDKVVVITDRRVLDSQLQATISQFEHVAGVVEAIESKGGAKSAKLAEALTGEKARIVICTLQTFSYVLDKVENVGQRNYAVIVDEAHSSQTGEAAKDLKAVLGKQSEEERLKAAEKAEAGEPRTAEDVLNEAVAARASQQNLSFFAFTATPKPRTVELFGTPVPGQDLKAPFHVYSMRQAIEEGFILDVLKFFTPFDVFWRVKQTNADDPEVEKTKATAEIARSVQLHPHNLGQRAKVIVEHFRDNVSHRIGGQAKAMVVTSSRLHAVRYKQAIDDYIARHHYGDVKTLVAFSGKVTDPDSPDETFTEPGMNDVKESETAGRFKGDPSPPFDPGEYQVMIVAEKYQTGFDAPLLHTMYVDKKLEGVAAVQTLARLNRTHPGKEETFVLDFRNSAEDIQEAFRDFYDTTIVAPVDANVLYGFQGALDSSGVFSTEDVERYWEAFAEVAPDQRKGNARLYAALDPSVERFKELDPDDQEQFRGDIDAYVRAYSFLSQIVTWGDADLEQLYVFVKSLRACLPAREGQGRLDLGSDVELTHLRLEMKAEVNASLAAEDATDDPMSALPGAGGGAGTPEKERLSAIISRLNEKHALNLSLTDALLFEQFKGDWLADPELEAAAKANSYDNFVLVFAKRFFDAVFGRMDANADIFKAINDDDTFANTLQDLYGRDVYETLRQSQQTP